MITKDELIRNMLDDKEFIERLKNGTSFGYFDGQKLTTQDYEKFIRKEKLIKISENTKETK